MDEKIRFVVDYERRISRETGYVWLRRYQRFGLTGPFGVEPGD